jgi:hypothetical protein
MKMNLNQIRAQFPEIAKIVDGKYPVSKAEMECANEKNTMDWLRLQYAKRLMVEDREVKEKMEYDNRQNQN